MNGKPDVRPAAPAAGRRLALAAAAGVVRWVAMAASTSVIALALVQPLHGLTFAALHLACMRVISAIVPQRLEATAQAIYALGAGATTALLTLASGWLYATLGAQGFLMMALLCAGCPADVGVARPSFPVISLRIRCGYDVGRIARYAGLDHILTIHDGGSSQGTAARARR